jgi:hypothetical protein
VSLAVEDERPPEGRVRRTVLPPIVGIPRPQMAPEGGLLRVERV